MRRLTPGDPTDLEILRALSGRVPSRLASLVTPGYVDCLVGAKDHSDAYRLTARGQAELLRRTEHPPAASTNGPPAPAPR